MSPPPASRSKAPPEGPTSPRSGGSEWDAEFKLVCVAGPLLHHEFPLDQQPEKIIGAAPGAAISLGTHAGVSKRHAALVRHAEGWSIRHLSLDHPTELNGKELRGVERKLEPGDAIAVLPFRFLFVEAEQTVLQEQQAGLSAAATNVELPKVGASADDETVVATPRSQREVATREVATRKVEKRGPTTRPPLRRARHGATTSERSIPTAWLAAAVAILVAGAGGLYWLWVKGSGSWASAAELQAQRAIESLRTEKWDEAGKALAEAIRHDPKNEGLRRLLERAEREQANAGRLAAAEGSLAKDDLSGALA
jgi:FHA domain